MNAILILLAVIGGLALLAVLAALVIFVVVKKKLGNALKNVTGSLGPEKITLVANGGPVDPEIEKRSTMFESMGFQRIGAFNVPEMPDVDLVALVRPSEHFYAVVYRHRQAGVWSDVALRYADAGGLTVSNAPMGGMLDQRPGYKKIYEKEKDERALLEIARTSVHPGAPLRATSVDAFAEAFQTAYADEMEWRYSRGGATLQEIQRVAQGSPERYGADAIAAAQEIIETHANEVLSNRCRDLYAKTLDGVQWQKVQDRVVIVHEQHKPGAAWGLLEPALGHSSVGDGYEKIETEAQRIVGQVTSPFVVAERVEELLPQPARWQVVHKFTAPDAWVVVLAEDP